MRAAEFALVTLLGASLYAAGRSDAAAARRRRRRKQPAPTPPSELPTVRAARDAIRAAGRPAPVKLFGGELLSDTIIRERR